MDEADRYTLNSTQTYILENLDANHVVDHLIVTGVLDPNHDEEIRAEKTAKRRTQKLLEILPDTRADALRHFRDALKDYGHIVDKLDAVVIRDQIGTDHPIPGMGGLNTAAAVATAATGSGMITSTRTRNNVTTITGNGNFVIVGGNKTTVNFH